MRILKRTLRTFHDVYAVGAVILVVLVMACLCCVVFLHPVFIIPLVFLLRAFYHVHGRYECYAGILRRFSGHPDSDVIEVDVNK